MSAHRTGGPSGAEGGSHGGRLSESVALMWSACPEMRGHVPATINLIRATAVPLTGQTGSSCGGDYTAGPNNDWGFGTISAVAAVQAAFEWCDGVVFVDGFESGSTSAWSATVP
jgi:hypothetical protein